MNMISQVSTRPAVAHARRALVLVLVLVASMALGNGTASSSGLKTYTADFTVGLEDPAVRSVAAGAVETFYATLTNTSDNQSLGSANISPPTGFDLTGTAFIEAGSSGTAEVPNGSNVVEVRNLSLAPGSQAIVAFEAAVPCTPGTVSWGIAAKQANTFNGPPGNDFTLDTAKSFLDVTVTGGCGAALRFFAQPEHAEAGTAITSEPVNPEGNPVQVEVIDADGNRATSSTADITVRLHSDPPGALDHILEPMTVRAVDGVASFEGLTIGVHGSNYKLHATSPPLTDAVSDAFGVWDQVVRCESDQTCNSTIEEQRSMQATVSMDTSTDETRPGALLVSLGADTVDCGDTFNHAPTAVTVDAIELEDPEGDEAEQLERPKTVTLRIDKVVDQQQANNGVSFYEVCFKRPGEPEFLLPACGAAAPPCIAAKTKTKAGDVIVTVSLPAGDPIMR